MAQSLAFESVQALDVQGAASTVLHTIARVVPTFIAFVLILIVGFLVATFVAKAVDAILERVGFDRAVERGGVGRALARSKYDASDLVAKFVYYAILLFALQLAFGIWGPNPVSDLISRVVAWLPQAAIAIIIVVVAAAIANAVRDLVTGALGGLSYGRILGNVAAVFILGLGIIAALAQIGVAVAVVIPVLIAVLATIAGILIVGVGGGLVRPMQQRWERWLNAAEQEVPTVTARVGSETPAPAPTTPAPFTAAPTAAPPVTPPPGSQL